MKISKLELERYIEAFKEDKEKWLTNKTYLEDNGLYDILDIIEILHKYTLEQIVKVLEILEVEVV